MSVPFPSKFSLVCVGLGGRSYPTPFLNVDRSTPRFRARISVDTVGDLPLPKVRIVLDGSTLFVDGGTSCLTQPEPLSVAPGQVRTGGSPPSAKGPYLRPFARGPTDRPPTVLHSAPSTTCPSPSPFTRLPSPL